MKAELAAAEWMRRLGRPSAYADGVPGPDGGIDVEADDAVGQVKHYSNSAVGIAEIQRLFGIAQERRVDGFFFALSGYSNQAIRTADATGVLLFTYTVDGELEGASEDSQLLLAKYRFNVDLSKMSNRSVTISSDHHAPDRLTDLQINQLRVDLMGLEENTKHDHAALLIARVDRPLRELATLAQNGPFRAEALASPWCGRAAIDKAASDIAPTAVPFRLAVAANSRCPQRVLSRLAQTDPDPRVRAAGTSNPSLPLEQAALALEDPNAEVRSALAQHPGVTADLLNDLSHEPDPRCRKSAARHPRCDPDTLVRLAKDPIVEVRIAVARNPTSTAPTLTLLSTDDDPFCRQLVAENANCPIKVLAELAEDANSNVRVIVASHPRTPEAIFERLAVDPDQQVRHAIETNPAIPSYLRQQLKQQRQRSDRKRVAVVLGVLVASVTAISSCYGYLQSASTLGTCDNADESSQATKISAQILQQRDGDLLIRLTGNNTLDTKLKRASELYVRAEAMTVTRRSFRFPIAGPDAFQSGSEDVAMGFDNSLPGANYKDQSLEIRIPDEFAPSNKSASWQVAVMPSKGTIGSATVIEAGCSFGRVSHP